MSFDLNAASNILKVFYLPPVREMLNNSSILLSRIDRDETTQDVSGTSFTVPLHTGRNISAATGRAESGDLPTAGQQAYNKAVVPNKYIYGRIQISGPVIAATKNNAGAFVRAVESEMKGLLRDTKRSVNRQLHSWGQDHLAFWTEADDAYPAVTVDDGGGNAFTHLPAGVGISCDLVDATDNYTLLETEMTITQGAESANSFAIAVTVNTTTSGATDGDYLVPTGTVGGANTNYTMMGIRGIVSAADPANLTGGLHGLTVASAPWWKAQVVGTEGTNVDLSFVNMQKVFSKIASNSDFSEKDVKFLLCNYAVRDKYVELCVNERRYYNTMTLDGGFEAVEFNGKPIVPDPQCAHNRLYYITPETLRLFRSADFDWMDKDGSTFSRVTNKDAYEATLFHYGDLGCVARNGNGLLLGISE
jgi:hypothetical protein